MKPEEKLEALKLDDPIYNVLLKFGLACCKNHAVPTEVICEAWNEIENIIKEG